MKKILCTVIFIAMVLNFSLISQTFAEEKDVIKIGILFPFSGPLAVVGLDNLEAWEIVSEIVNERGGIRGKKLVGIKADAVDPKTAMSEAERLITMEKVNIIVGTYSSPRALVASEIAEKYKKIYYETGAAADELTNRNMKYFFRIQVRGSDYGKMGARFISKEWAPAAKIDLKKLKVVSLYEDSIWGTTINKAFIETAKESGFSVMDSFSYNYKATDFSGMITRIKSIDPDVVYGVNYPNDFLLLWRQMKQLDLNFKAYIGNGTLIHESLPEALGKDIDYVFNIQGVGLQNFNLDSISKETRTFYNELTARYEKKYNKKINTAVYGVAYTMWLLLDKILPMAGSDDPEAVRKAILSIDVPLEETLLGFGVKFDAASGQNISAVPGVMQWQNKKLATIYPATLSVAEMWPVMPNWADR